MKIKLTATVFLIAVLGALLSIAGSAQQADDPGVLLRAAIEKEEVDGDLQGAIELYKEIIAKYGGNRAIAAKAQLHIGFCYEKLGKAEAIKAYELVLKNYPDQPEFVATARVRMAELTAKKPSEPSKTRIYSWADDDLLLESTSLSPDGTKLLGIHISRPTGQNVVYKDLNTGKFQFVTNFDWESEGHGYTYNPVWSPVGKQVAFRYDGWKDPLQELRISDLKGKSQTIYRCKTKDDEIYPVEWFPEERTILAIRITPEKLIRLGIVSIKDGTFDSLYEVEPHKGAKLKPDANSIIKADLSPDGRQVVFHEVKQGVCNIYVLFIVDKTVKALLDSPAESWQPCWSPDGKHIAFMSDRAGTDAAWAISMNAVGSAKGQPFLIKDGQSINLVNWTAHGLCYVSGISMVDVFIMPVDPQTGAPTGKPRQLEFRPTGRNSHPVWSPDGKHLAFVSNLYGIHNEHYVVIYPVSGGEARKFRVPSPREQRMVPRMIDLRWLPDGSGISYSAESAQKTAGSEEDVDFKMYVLKLDSGEWHSWDLKLEVNSSFTDWRGDGKGIYYARYPFSKKNYKLAPGIVERDLTTDDERYIYRPEKIAGFASIRCSRDFSKLAFHQILNGPLVVIDIKSGEKLNEFKDVGFPSPPTWSPDGKMLMISKWRRDNKLHVISVVDGSRKAYEVDMDFFPKSGILVMDWAPDGTKIAFANTYTNWATYILQDVIPKK